MRVRIFREILGASVLLAGGAMLFRSLRYFAEGDPLAAIVSTVGGIALLGVAVEVFRSSSG